MTTDITGIPWNDVLNGHTATAVCDMAFSHQPAPPGTIIKPNSLIYTRTDLYNHVVNLAHSQKAPIVLVTMGCDFTVTDQHVNFLSPYVKRWFTINCWTNSPRVQAIPIGPDVKSEPHIDFPRLLALRSTPKTKFVMMAHNTNTNPSARRPVDQMFGNQPWVNNFCGCPYGQYLHELSQHRFIISPPGNGIDCHRTWEAVWAGCIPVVLRSPVVEKFKHMPILIVDRWSDVTMDYLIKSENEVRKRLGCVDALRVSTWLPMWRSYV